MSHTKQDIKISKPKKILIGLGIFLLLIIIGIAITTGLSRANKAKWEATANEQAKKLVQNMSDLSKAQFNAYWGEASSLPEEQREKIVDWASQFGTLVSIKSSQLNKYSSFYSLTGKGSTHKLIYDVRTEFTNGPLTFRFTFRVKEGLMYTDNMELKPI